MKVHCDSGPAKGVVEIIADTQMATLEVVTLGGQAIAVDLDEGGAMLIRNYLNGWLLEKRHADSLSSHPIDVRSEETKPVTFRGST